MYAITGQGIEQLWNSFGFIFLLFPVKVAGVHAHSTLGKSLGNPLPALKQH